MWLLTLASLVLVFPGFNDEDFAERLVRPVPDGCSRTLLAGTLAVVDIIG